jgi:hypothetical protein
MLEAEVSSEVMEDAGVMELYQELEQDYFLKY